MFSQPLTGKTILVTRSAGQSSQFTALLQAQGATVLEMPTLEITPPSTWEPLDRAIGSLHEFDWLILTSANGVDYFFDRLSALGLDAQALAEIKIAVVGKKTAASLRLQGLYPDYIPPNFVADSLVECFPEADRLANLKLLFPRVETGGREVLVKELTAKGATVVEVPAYESGCAQTVPPEVQAAFQQGTIDMITFASSKTVRCFCQMWAMGQASEPSAFSLSSAIAIASIGPQTSITCQELLGRVDIEAEDYTLEGLTEAIVRWVATH
ncbi:uroporphyrinogen-III synthase [filamentous cyanobacterium CCP2]|nr:uroporphyrinogen-III synthase [filamentous cyanobacterium CCP2]